jgi:hypothetical protein
MLGLLAIPVSRGSTGLFKFLEFPKNCQKSYAPAIQKTRAYTETVLKTILLQKKDKDRIRAQLYLLRKSIVSWFIIRHNKSGPCRS